VQHVYEILTVGIKETELNISLTAFPNKITENLTLQVSDYNNEKLFSKKILFFCLPWKVLVRIGKIYLLF